MNGLAPTELIKLAKIAGLLTSPHDGERAAAALLASRMLQSAGLTWEQFVLGRPTVEAISAPSARTTGGWRADLDLCQRRMSFTTRWEQDFIADVSRLPTLSTKQRLILVEVAAKLRKRGLS